VGSIFQAKGEFGVVEPEIEDAIRREVAAAHAVADARMADAATFMNAHGAAVLAGHPMVGSPGNVGSDPDTYGPDESDLPNE
jgi:hypothetical protein